MSEFNITSWMKKQYLAEAKLDTPKSSQLASAINSAIEGIDSEMNYRDFAVAVASILENEYGSHLYDKFMEVLHAELGMNESLNEMYSSGNEEIGKEFSEEFGVRAYSDPFKIEIMEMGDINGRIFGKMIQWVESKGYKVDRSQSDNTFDMDEDRYFYPRIIISK